MQETAESFVLRRKEQLLSELLDFLRIPSISTQPEHRSDVLTAAAWVAQRLCDAGPFQVETYQTAGHPVVYGSWLGAPGAPTILIYGHYDVQPPDPLEKWQSEPFEPDIRDERIYARGVSDDKGPMFIPIKAAEALFATEGRLPVNLKMLFEGEEEIGSPHLEDFVQEHAEMLRADYALSADGAMWRSNEPSITTGSRGLVGFELVVKGPRTDLHSGRHGGAVLNPLHALATLVTSFHRNDGTVAVQGFYDGVVEPTQAERDQIAALNFDEQQYGASVGVQELFGEAGYSTLERQWLRPTLEINGLFGGYQGPGAKTVIPAEAHAKVTCRLVPGQKPHEVLQRVVQHVIEHTPPGVSVEVMENEGGATAYRIAADHPGLGIASQVLQRRYDREPAIVLMGGTLPISEIFFRVLGLDTVFFSFSTADEAFHAPNEFFRLARLWDGILTWIDFWRTAGA